ncbi:hypothetical protein LTR59_005462 [Friedmanniomyces endolithicus]|nr:hypothetical protein LTR38_017105 [Friedmanniomyces endolithicus]KAK0801170.1 hypothetical protein LTR59_005462 [Friedmanniomyces endolithicus]
MLSVQPTTGSWMRSGDFSSDLSKVIWIVQLVIFYHSAQQEHRGHGRTLASIQECCAVYLHPANETPMEEILRRRLLLFHVRDHTVGDQQAGWNEQEDEVTYGGTTLRMDHIPTLLKSEYQHCHQILYEELMLHAKGFRHMHAPASHDRFDVQTVHWRFKDHPGNADLLRSTDRFLLNVIERSEYLSRLFVMGQASTAGKWTWRQSAIATFEAHVQSFLARLCVLIHISSGQPIREPEFFSMMWRNTQRLRHITIRHDRVMIHTQYGKQQQQQGLYQDSVRFLAQPIGTLLLDYLVFVLPLRELPRLHVSNWRQITVAIVKTKFAGDAICFDLEDVNGDGEEIEADIKAMTEQRNHKTRTVNRAYANQALSSSTFANVYDGLIRKGLRASQLWHAF